MKNGRNLNMTGMINSPTTATVHVWDEVEQKTLCGKYISSWNDHDHFIMMGCITCKTCARIYKLEEAK